MVGPTRGGPTRTQLAWQALSNEARLRLFSMMVDSVLSYGAEVWGVQLATKAGWCGGWGAEGRGGSSPQ